MNILVLNSGSSSIKFQLFDMGDGERPLLKGIADKIGLENSLIRSEGPNGGQDRRAMALPDHRAALQAVFDTLHDQDRTAEPADEHRRGRAPGGPRGRRVR